MEPTTETFVDPVCGMEVTADTAAASLEYGPKTYYFCSPGCRTLFEMDPEKYVSHAAGESHT